MNALTRKLVATLLLATLAISSAACATTQNQAHASSNQDHDVTTCVTPHELNQIPAVLR